MKSGNVSCRCEERSDQIIMRNRKRFDNNAEDVPYDVSSANVVIERSACEMQGSTRTLVAHAAWMHGIVSLSRFQRSLEEQGITILGPSWPTRVCGPCIFQGFFSFCDGKVTRSQSVPETPNVRLTKSLGTRRPRAWKAVQIAHLHRRPVHTSARTQGRTNFEDTVRGHVKTFFHAQRPTATPTHSQHTKAKVNETGRG